jgi:hypothetical protein
MTRGLFLDYGHPKTAALGFAQLAISVHSSWKRDKDQRNQWTG